MNYTYKNIWLIGYPVMMSILMEQLINITDAIFLGHVGNTELGASAIAGIYYLAVYMLGFGFCTGLQVTIARRNGERNYSETGKTFFQGLWFLTALSVILFLFSKYFSPLLLHRLIKSDEVYTAVMKYTDWRSFGLLFAFPALAFRAFFVGTTKTRTLTGNAGIMIVANTGLNFLLIFGKAGFPALGITGAALASTLSELISLGIFTVYTLIKVDRHKYGFSPVFHWHTLKEVLRISVWSMMHSFTSVAPWLLFFISIEQLGKNELAVANIIRSISALFFVIVSALGAITGSLVSNLLGAGERDGIRPVCSKVIRLGYRIGIPLIFTAILFHNRIIGIYTTDSMLIDKAFAPFLVMLSNYLISVPAFVYLNAVTGLGATRRAFAFQVITIVFYLVYLGTLNRLPGTPLAVYCTVEHLFVFILLILSLLYLKKHAGDQESDKLKTDKTRTIGTACRKKQ